jgi:signal transduction histidine kinase
MHEFMRKIPLFADLPDADLHSISEAAQEIRLAPGEELIAEGTVGQLAYVIQEGELEILKQVDGRTVLLAVRSEPGDIIGEMALLEASPRMASVRARTPATLLTIHKEQFDYLIDCRPAAARIMLHTVLTRWRATEALLRQSERMAQLATFTAGMAHELNNPAAAIKRSVDLIGQAIADAQWAYGSLREQGLGIEQQAALEEYARQVQLRPQRPAELSALERSDREVALERWLEQAGVEPAWELAPSLVSMGYDAASLASLATQFGPTMVSLVVPWLSTHAAVFDMLAEIGEGAQRISEIVKVLKGYVVLDQAPLQTIDVHEGIEDTLFILRHRLGSGIRVNRQYGADLPRIEAYASELNQVWTNLIDNAVDAMGGHGQITIRTHRAGDGLMVEIEDNGPGIPPEIQKRVFDPFFTTKAPGKGVGLGLKVAYDIVIHRHRGHVELFSEPGSTRFQVWLPLSCEVTQ